MKIMNTVRALLVAIVFVATNVWTYHSAGVVAYHWQPDGSTKVLLGQEWRSDVWNPVWINFTGLKDSTDYDALETAKREAQEESAYQLTWLHTTKPLQYGSEHVTYFLPVADVDPKQIAKAAQSGLYEHVEKFEWRWVDAQTLLDGKTGLDLYYKFEHDLQPGGQAHKLLQKVLEQGREWAKRHHKTKKHAAAYAG